MTRTVSQDSKRGEDRLRPRLLVPLERWTETYCARPLTQVNRFTKQLRTLPGHRARSLRCSTCGPERVREELAQAVAVLPDPLFITELPDARERKRVTERMSKRAKPGPRLVIAREDSPRVLMLSGLSLSKSKGLDRYPSRKGARPEGLALMVEALALPGLPVRGAVTWTGAWAAWTVSPPYKAAAGGSGAAEWLNVHASLAEAKQRLCFLAAETSPKAPPLEFADWDSGLGATVQADDVSWLRIVDALVNDLPDEVPGWDDEPVETSSSAESPSQGLLGDSTEDHQPDAVLAKLPVGQQLLLDDAMVTGSDVGHTGSTEDVLPAVETSAATEVEATC